MDSAICTTSLNSKDQLILRVDDADNIFNLSSLKAFEHKLVSHCFAVKFVRSGTERYRINNASYTVNAGSYLLLNGEKDGHVSIDEHQLVKGMCLNISNDLVSEVVASYQAPDTPISDSDLAAFFYTEHFLENQYNSAHNQLGKKLQEIDHLINTGLFSKELVTRELFYELAESLVADQIAIFRQLQSIKTVRSGTQRDLCRRVLRGKEFIDSHFTDALTIEQIAQNAGMSEYHFFRMFKQMTGSTPYQYILASRLQVASTLLKSNHSVSDAAFAAGFSDIFTFSKTFKKHFGVSPKQFTSVKS